MLARDRSAAVKPLTGNEMQMNRRELIKGAAATAACAAAALPADAAPFASNRISVVVRGSGPDVVLIPGLTAGRAVWSGLVAGLPGYRYHLVEVAGFAGSAVGGNAQGAVLAPLAAEIARYIAASGLRAPAVIGHSMGGTIAMMLATRHPARVGKVMAVDILPAPAGMFGASAASVRPLADALLESVTSTPGGQRLLQSLLGGGGNVGGARSDSNLVARATHELALLDLADDLPKIAVPFTVVYAMPPAARADPAATMRTYQAAYRPARNARLVPIADSGHMIMYDQPARFREAVRAFLAARG